MGHRDLTGERRLRTIILGGSVEERAELVHDLSSDEVLTCRPGEEAEVVRSVLAAGAAADGIVLLGANGEPSAATAGALRLLALIGSPDVALVPRSDWPAPGTEARLRSLAEVAGLTNVAFVTRDALLAGGAPGRAAAAPPSREAADTSADSFRAHIVWHGAEPLLRGRAYLLRIGNASVTATVSPVKYRLDLLTGEHVAASQLCRGEIGACDLELGEAVSVVAYRDDRAVGSFVLDDPITGEEVGAGMIEYALRRSANVRWQPVGIDKALRGERLGQRPTVLWLTGLSGAGKSTIANRLEIELTRRGYHTYLLDGDNVRHGLNADLGFTAADRVENIRRVAEVTRLMVDAGLIVIVSFISPFRAERAMARSLLQPDEFIEVFVDTPLAVAEARDVKGLYAKARRGELANFTGIDSPYEAPESPEIRIDTTQSDASAAVELLLRGLTERGRLEASAVASTAAPGSGPTL